MSRDVRVSLLVPDKEKDNTFLTSIQKSKNYTRMLPLILLDKVEVVPSHDDGPLHLGAVASTG